MVPDRAHQDEAVTIPRTAGYILSTGEKSVKSRNRKRSDGHGRPWNEIIRMEPKAVEDFGSSGNRIPPKLFTHPAFFTQRIDGITTSFGI
jgi:hypothetical protein